MSSSTGGFALVNISPAIWPNRHRNHKCPQALVYKLDADAARTDRIAYLQTGESRFGIRAVEAVREWETCLDPRRGVATSKGERSE